MTIVDGVSYPTTVDATGKYYTSNFGAGLTISKGFSKEISIKGDIISGSGRTVAFNEGGLKRGIGQVRWTAGNLVTPPVDEVLQLRQKGGKADYYQYVKNT